MKHAFVRDHREEFDVLLMCEVLGASKIGFYAWVGRDRSGKVQSRLELKIANEKAFVRGRGSYGSPRIYKVLKGLGYQVSEDTVAKLMQEISLKAKTKRKFRVATTDSKHTLHIAEKRLDQVFEASMPGEMM